MRSILVIALSLALASCASSGPATGEPGGLGTESFATEEFAVPLRIDAPAGYLAYEGPSGVVVQAPTADLGVIPERFVVFHTPDAMILDTLEGFQPWPSDLASWLDQHLVGGPDPGPESARVDVAGTEEDTVAGSPVTVISATSSFEAPPDGELTLNLIAVGDQPEGTDVLMLTDEMEWRFFVFDDRPLAIAYGATHDSFSQDRLDGLLESLTFTGG